MQPTAKILATFDQFAICEQSVDFFVEDLINQNIPASYSKPVLLWEYFWASMISITSFAELEMFKHETIRQSSIADLNEHQKHKLYDALVNLVNVCNMSKTQLTELVKSKTYFQVALLSSASVIHDNDIVEKYYLHCFNNNNEVYTVRSAALFFQDYYGLTQPEIVY